MSCSVNLVPAVRAQAHAFASRRRNWISVFTAGALLVGLGWAAQYATRRTLTRLSSQTDVLTAQCALAQTRVQAADEERAQLLARLKLLAAARRSQPWAARLAALTRSAPEGVFLTQLDVSAKSAERPEPASVAAPPARELPPPRPLAALAHDVRLQGLALDHTALIQLLNTLQSSPDWQRVELVRATSEPFGGRTVVAFEFDCRAQESHR